jgi:hypothetical protein
MRPSARHFFYTAMYWVEPHGMKTFARPKKEWEPPDVHSPWKAHTDFFSVLQRPGKLHLEFMEKDALSRM